MVDGNITPADMLERITSAKLAAETACLTTLMAAYEIPLEIREKSARDSEKLISHIRHSNRLPYFDAICADLGLTTPEGVALLRLSESLMRVPDGPTARALIADKLTRVDWNGHRGESQSQRVSATLFALDMVSRILGKLNRRPGAARSDSLLRAMFLFPSTSFIRQGLRLLGRRFVHGTTMARAIRRARELERKGFTHSYDMLGEEALTAHDADRFFEDYTSAITALRKNCQSSDFRDNPGISIKLSALHPRYEMTQKERVLDELSDKLLTLSLLAKDLNMGLNIDAEEADRQELSLGVIERVLRNQQLAGWDGFGIVVQAYNKAAPYMLDYLYALAAELDRKIMVRLVKGAYWDKEIKRAQVEGLRDFPVYTRKSATDVAYLCCAQKLMGMTDRVYPQFATQNAQTAMTIAHLAAHRNVQSFEFQRMHGMMEPLHHELRIRFGTRCRIYAPVGRYRELLPYLARRLLENGANSSFVNQFANRRYAASAIAADPFKTLEKDNLSNRAPITRPENLFGSERVNSKGWDLHSPSTQRDIESRRAPFRTSTWDLSPKLAVNGAPKAARALFNPARPDELIGTVCDTRTVDLQAAISAATPWTGVSPEQRGRILRKASDLYESQAGEIFALLCREAGKTLRDATGELREAIDFLRYYAQQAEQLTDDEPAGVVACISPWNFPLAILTGQVAGALAAGNGCIAKPAEQSPLVAGLAVDMLHEAGVPREVLQLVPGAGEEIGAALVSSPSIAGVAFTGSTATAQAINRTMSRSMDPTVPLVAETGGLNVMIIDSTSLPEQAVSDIVTSSFQSAGQRCSAARMIYVQRDIEESFLNMLFGTMDELVTGDPWNLSTDVGPLIDEKARQRVSAHIDHARQEGRLLKQCDTPRQGHFVAPAVIRVGGIADVQEDVFGPVAHVASFRPADLGTIVESINESGYGLTFGLHTRIDTRMDDLASRLKVGNIYINRNQIGAVVESQPFGGEGLSGTGPKAGGVNYVRAFCRKTGLMHEPPDAPEVDPAKVQDMLNEAGLEVSHAGDFTNLPGPTGESNRLGQFARGTILCLGPTAEDSVAQAVQARAAGCACVQIAPGANGQLAMDGFLPRIALSTLSQFDAVALWSSPSDLREVRRALAAREGRIIPLLHAANLTPACRVERHICIDTTAAGGNAAIYHEASS